MAPRPGFVLRPDAVFRRCSDVRFRTVLEEGVVIKQQTAEVLVLNTVGARVLELLDGQRTVAEVQAALAAEFAAPAESLAQDVTGYLDELLQAGIVEDVRE
jgi:coenzyme PQQ biosynthesis protein PqqD